jgi:hypothetical protein
MVMRNRHEGSGAPHWWDDLPPHLRGRFSLPPPEEADEADGLPSRAAYPATRPLSRADFLIDLSRFAMVFLLISAVILLYLLVALTYVNS